MQIFKGKSYSDTKKNFSEKNFGNFLNFDSIYGRVREIKDEKFFFKKLFLIRIVFMGGWDNPLDPLPPLAVGVQYPALSTRCWH